MILASSVRCFPAVMLFFVMFLSPLILADQVSVPDEISGAEVRKLVQQAGTSKPDWWDSVPLEYPDTLDLAGTNKAQGWQPKRNLGAYVHSIINPNQSQWKKGAKLLHHVIDFRKRDKTRQAQAMGQLAHIYFHLLCDYPRAAYWYEQKQRSGGRVGTYEVVDLAECYWRIGSEKLAMATLSRYGLTSRRINYAAANLLAKMGHFEKAISMAEALAKNARTADEGMLVAANACRNIGKLAEARQWYSQISSLSQGSRYLKKNKARATECIKAVDKLMVLDISQVPDGSYDGSAIGYKGEVAVRVTVAGGKIASLDITDQHEDKAHSNFTQMPGRIASVGKLEGVDAVSGATITSEAILNASADALYNGAKAAGVLKQ